MIRCGSRAARIPGSGLASRPFSERCAHGTRLRVPHGCRPEKSKPWIGYIPRKPRFLGPTTRPGDFQQRRKAELDYIDFKSLNGVYDDEEEPTEHEVDPDEAFEDLDKDVEELDAHKDIKTAFQLGRISSLFGFLADKKELGRRGEGLFLLTLLVTCSILAPPVFFRGIIPVVGVCCFLCGVGSAILGIVCLGDAYSPFPVPRQGSALVQTGIFKFVRHPFYAGLLLISAGLSAVSANEFRLLMTGVLWWIIDQTINGEEKDLERVHAEYAEYKTKVARLIPGIY